MMSVSRYEIGQTVYWWATIEQDIDSAIVKDAIYHPAEFTNIYEGYVYKLNTSKFGHNFSSMPETHLFGSRMECLKHELRDAEDRLKEVQKTCHNIAAFKAYIQEKINLEQEEHQ